MLGEEKTGNIFYSIGVGYPMEVTTEEMRMRAEKDQTRTAVQKRDFEMSENIEHGLGFLFYAIRNGGC